MTDVLARRKQQEIERLPPAHAREQPFLPLASKTPEDQPFWVWEQPSSGLHDFFLSVSRAWYNSPKLGPARRFCNEETVAAIWSTA